MVGETLAIVDDRPLRRSFLVAFIEKNMRVSLIAGSDVEDVLEQLEHAATVKTNGPKVVVGPEEQEDLPDVLTLVLMNFGGETVEPGGETGLALRQAVAGFPDAAVVVVSDIDTREAVLDAFRLGASGYLTTAMDEAVMLATLQLIQAGGRFAPAEILLREDGEEGGGGARPPRKSCAEVANGHAKGIDPRLERQSQAPLEEELEPPEEVYLSPRESQVLAEIKRGMQNKQIAYELAMSESTVKVHVRNIMKKLDVKNRTQAAMRARQLDLPVAAAALQQIAIPPPRLSAG